MPEKTIPESLRKFAKIKQWEFSFGIEKTGVDNGDTINIKVVGKATCLFKGYSEQKSFYGVTGNYLLWQGIAKVDVSIYQKSAYYNSHLGFSTTTAEGKDIPLICHIWIDENGTIKVYRSIPKTTINLEWSNYKIPESWRQEKEDHYNLWLGILFHSEQQGYKIYPVWTLNDKFIPGKKIEKSETVLNDAFGTVIGNKSPVHLSISLKPVAKLDFVYEVCADTDEEEKIKNVVLEIQHPDGSIKKHTTDEDGKITLEGDPDDQFILMGVEQQCCDSNFIKIVDSEIKE